MAASAQRGGAVRKFKCYHRDDRGGGGGRWVPPVPSPPAWRSSAVPGRQLRVAGARQRPPHGVHRQPRGGTAIAVRREGMGPDARLYNAPPRRPLRGNPGLKQRFLGCTIYGPSAEEPQIVKTCGLGLDEGLAGGAKFEWGGGSVDVIDVGGHTLGHIAYHWRPLGPAPEGSGPPGAAFVGDSLFVLGCGRLFEGTADQAHASLNRLMALPDETVVYCAHEYSEANAAFAETIEEPGTNAALDARVADIRKRRANSSGGPSPTVPTTIGMGDRRIRSCGPRGAGGAPAQGGLTEASTDGAFAGARRRKDGESFFLDD